VNHARPNASGWCIAVVAARVAAAWKAAFLGPGGLLVALAFRNAAFTRQQDSPSQPPGKLEGSSPDLNLSLSRSGSDHS